jgi:predicted lipid-binding transport protein (Tim44 family)
MGSRGSRTSSSPPPTATAPRSAAPIQRTITQPGRAGSTAGQVSRPFGGIFGGGLLGGLAAGFLGAGLFGMLFGHGFLGGMGGFASFLGLLLQIVIVVFVARLAWAWWQRRNQPAYASGPSLRDSLPGAAPSGGGFGGFGSSQAPLQVTPEDFNTFEQMLGEIQTAYGNEDVHALRERLTPEMVSYFVEEMTRNSSQGAVNKISDVKLLQGDLSEAWREGSDEYATVAMRYSLNDTMVDRASGKVLQIEPSEANELWTFRRAGGGHWMLSAIQQS